ncbi:MAG: hypothetical protein IJW21_07885, partial [Clostridia bacterium]|nr:hypothetical protein [Clostridia bacterium]
MAQTLLIGLGGTGSRVVNEVVRELNERSVDINNGNICCAVLDTNRNDIASILDSGTGVPTIATSRDWKVKDYVREFSYKDIEDWAPKSSTFYEQNMLDGAAQMRVKSRMAFMETVQNGAIKELENIIMNLLHVREQSKLQVMITSSISGGTGAGMFIQTALWIRKFFDERDCQISIRGIFLLPDVFIENVKDIKNRKMDVMRHYANAYAAIREINAITRIRLGSDTETKEHICIDGLFDSEVNRNDGKPVFDFAFFVDNMNVKGDSVNGIDKYEKLVAQLIYIQLYSPMTTPLRSEEDNAFLGFEKNPEPLYGSCGTAKALYPTKDILEYCALRAAKESMKTGWRKIDDDIDAALREEKAAEEEGVFIARKVDPRVKYIELFNEFASKTAEEAGNDRLFISIKHDIHKETKKQTG